MVSTRSAAKALKTMDDPPLERLLGDLMFPLTKKRKPHNGTATSEEEHRVECHINLDVLFLISKNLHPRDLLNLARVSKHFQQLLMEKSSAFVWRAARHQVDGLPDCPTDLTEARYAILVFDPRCHGCAKPVYTTLWELRRRYCSGCKQTRLWRLSSCDRVIQTNRAMPYASVALEEGSKVTTQCVDKEQMESFMREYSRSSDKKKFIKDKREQRAAVFTHADLCRDWEKDERVKPLTELFKRVHDRDDSIMKRLKQDGFEREVGFFTPRQLLYALRPIFDTHREVTDKEWSQHWHELLETMNQFRSTRLEEQVYTPRRQLLASRYTGYVMHPTANAPAVELLPHLADLFSFPLFRDIIRAPEETQVDDNAFGSAFAHLPNLIGEWRERIDAGIAELVEIPSHLSPGGPLQPTANKLGLACALFHANAVGLFTYPEVLFASTKDCDDLQDLCDDERSIGERYRIAYIREAPYVVRACGLDPNVATPCDMDFLNASLMCLSCDDQFIRHWRDAISHAFHVHGQEGQNDIETVRWQVVTDEEACHNILMRELVQSWYQCLLCLPRVGDAMFRDEITSHCEHVHNVNGMDIRQGVHIKPVGLALQAIGRVPDPQQTMVW